MGQSRCCFLLFLQRKKRQEHTNGEREGRAAETENTAAVVVLTLPLHLIVKERAQRTLLSFPLRLFVPALGCSGHCSAFLSTLAVL